MKKTLIRNYWLVILGWCALLNDYSVLGTLLLMAGDVLLFFNIKKLNLYKVVALSLLSYGVILFCLFNTSIPYFFEDLHVFMFGICLNAALVNEKLYAYKYKTLLPIMSVMLICVLILSLIIIFVPDSLYSLFTKHNLFLMECFIVIPYNLPLTLCVVKKIIKQYRVKIVIHEKATTM